MVMRTPRAIIANKRGGRYCANAWVEDISENEGMEFLSFFLYLLADEIHCCGSSSEYKSNIKTFLGTTFYTVFLLAFWVEKNAKMARIKMPLLILLWIWNVVCSKRVWKNRYTKVVPFLFIGMV